VGVAPARKAKVLDLRKPMRERDGFSAGVRWIELPVPPRNVSPV
jgi:hypothetical protein